jgi:enamine deaminase RidA (YjgF/YER057c/UK114 family)
MDMAACHRYRDDRLYLAHKKENDMTRTLISSGSPFEKTVGYSRAVVQGDWCFVAGTTGPDPETQQFPDDICDQVRNAFSIVEKAMAEGGFSLSDVVRATYYFTSVEYHDAATPILAEKFGSIRPAVSAIIVASLIRPEMKFELEITALRQG